MAFWNKGIKKKEEEIIEAINLAVEDSEKKLNPTLKKEVENKRRELIGKDSLSRQEILDAIEKHYNIKQNPHNNPYKTREDCYVTFYNYDMSVNRYLVPFEEIEISTKKFILNKTFENGEIKVNYLFYLPEIEINLENEYNKKEQTKKRLEDINKFILYVENKISQGYSEYRLIDLKDFRYEKVKLQKILETIKYGKTAIFSMTDPFNKKKTFLLRKSNQSYDWLKITEHNYITPEHTSRTTVSSEILRKVQKMLNFRNKDQLMGFLKALGIFLAVMLFVFTCWSALTFDEKLLDQRVKESVNNQLEPLTNEIEYLRGQLRAAGIKYQDNPNNQLDINEVR
jgi:hypothetical protein